MARRVVVVTVMLWIFSASRDLRVPCAFAAGFCARSAAPSDETPTTLNLNLMFVLLAVSRVVASLVASVVRAVCDVTMSVWRLCSACSCPCQSFRESSRGVIKVVTSVEVESSVSLLGRVGAR
jgi:hypothetical protein